MLDNFLYISDSYKYSHHKQYPENLTKLYSYFEARGFKSPFFHKPEVVFFGLQYLISKLEGSVITRQDVERAKLFYEKHFGMDIFNYDGFMHIVEKHDGRLPIRIKAVPEGTPIKPGNVLMTVENTDPEVPWLTNYVETFLTKVWYPTTVATLSREIKKTIAHYMSLTSDEETMFLIDFQLHDFGMRGGSSDETVALGGAAHLVNGFGTDTVSAMKLAQDYYGDPLEDNVVYGNSIPATEHSVMTIKGKDGELEQYHRVIDAYPDDAIVAIVSDSYDIYNVIENWVCGSLKDKILSRKGKIVLRPDSGDPEVVISHILNIFEKKMKDKITMNSKGYKVLPPQIGLIWGDGINHKDIDTILSMMKVKGWASSNIVFGMGGGLLQKVNRDSLKFAFKASYAEFSDGTSVEVYKDPITDSSKKSKRGMLGLTKNHDGDWETFKYGGEGSLNPHDHLNVVFEDGVLHYDNTFEDIRTRAKLDVVKLEAELLF